MGGGVDKRGWWTMRGGGLERVVDYEVGVD